MNTNKLLAVLAFIGVFLIIGGNFLFQNTPWIDMYWDVSDLYGGILFLVFGVKFLKQ